MARSQDETSTFDDRAAARQEAQAQARASAAPATPSALSPDTPPEAPGSEPPPANAGDEMPNISFPVPPVPPPPTPGPIFSLAGGGGGGAASFARPGTEAAKPFHSQLFATNRMTAGGAPPARFGAGTPITTGAASFLPAGLEGDSSGVGAGSPDDELKRILAMMRGGGA